MFEEIIHPSPFFELVLYVIVYEEI